MDNFYAVIMAGGIGERFWPLSTSRTPKQTLSLIGGKPLIQMAVERLEGLIPPERVIVVTSADLVDVTRKAAPELPGKNVIGEPFGRDTAAAVALASAIVKARNPKGVFCTLTADHIIGDLELFRATLSESAVIASNNDVLITIGIAPSFPSTGFGYIEFQEPFQHGGKVTFVKAKRFVEKPDAATAEKFIQSGKYCWNSGMFVWSVQSIQSAFKRCVPELYGMAQRMEAVVDTPDFDAKMKDEYSALNKISIDYAVMEKSDNILMARGTFQWSDVGSWDSLADHFETDSDFNVRVGDVEEIESRGNIVFSRDRLTALVGVSDLIVVQAGGATLVCHRKCAQDVKKLVQMLKKSGKHENLL